MYIFILYTLIEDLNIHFHFSMPVCDIDQWSVGTWPVATSHWLVVNILVGVQTNITIAGYTEEITWCSLYWDIGSFMWCVCARVWGLCAHLCEYGYMWLGMCECKYARMCMRVRVRICIPMWGNVYATMFMCASEWMLLNVPRSMYVAQCTSHNVRRSFVRCTMYIVQCTSLICTSYNVPRTLVVDIFWRTILSKL